MALCISKVRLGKAGKLEMGLTVSDDDTDKLAREWKPHERVDCMHIWKKSFSRRCSYNLGCPGEECAWLGSKDVCQHSGCVVGEEVRGDE